MLPDPDPIVVDGTPFPGAETLLILLLTTIIATPPDAARTEQVRAMVVEARDDLEQRFGLTLDEPEIVLAGTREVYDERVKALSGRFPLSWSRAVAFPTQGRIVVACDAASLAMGRPLREVLVHELCHLALAPYAIPLWFDEGLCELAAGRVAGPEEQTALARAAERDLLNSWQGLSDRFPSHADMATLAYAQAFDFVRYLDGHGEGVRGILTRLWTGMPFERAVAEACGSELIDLQEAWKVERAGGYSFLFDLAQQLGFWGLLGLFVIVVWGVEMWRRKKKRELLPD